MPESPTPPRLTAEATRRRVTTIDQSTRVALADISAGEVDGLELSETRLEATGLDERTFALVRIAVLIALDAPPASYAWLIANAIESGATAEDLLGVLRAVAPQVGGPRVVAAAPEIMLALGLSLPEHPG